MPMDLTPLRPTVGTAPTTKVRPDSWPEDEFFEILAVKDRAHSQTAKGEAYEEFTDAKGRKKFRLNADKLQRAVIRLHLVGWAIRAGKATPRDEKKDGWLIFSPAAVERIPDGPATYLENEINARAGWLTDIDVDVQTATGADTAGFPGSS